VRVLSCRVPLSLWRVFPSSESGNELAGDILLGGFERIHVILCYEKVISAIKGRGIRQLLSEQASQIDELRNTRSKLLQSHDAQTPAADNNTLHVRSLE
jgi:hypothetical protein